MKLSQPIKLNDDCKEHNEELEKSVNVSQKIIHIEIIYIYIVYD